MFPVNFRQYKFSLQYRCALLVAFFTGCAALAHELLWTRRLIDLVGATTGATVLVFGCFFFGLAVGSAVSSLAAERIKNRGSHGWAALAVAQFGVALLSVPIVTVTQWSDAVWSLLGAEGLQHFGGVIKLVFSLLILTPPSVMMGMTLPLLLQALPGECQSLRKQGIMLYAVNTAGGVFGLSIVSLFALQRFGVNGSLTATIALNCLLGLCCIILQKAERKSTTAVNAGIANSTEQKLRPGNRQFAAGLPFFLAFFSGAGILAAEILCLHLVRQVVQVSLYPETALLGCVIAMLAVSSALVAGLLRRFPSFEENLFPLLVACSGAAAIAVPLLFHGMTGGLLPLQPKTGVFAFMADMVKLTIASMGPFILLAGFVLPMTFIHFENRRGEASKREWGMLLAVNGIGGLIGTELADAVIMPLFGMNTGLGIIGLLYLLTAVIVIMYRRGKSLFSFPAISCLLLFAAGIVVVKVPVSRLPLLSRAHWNSGENRVVDVACGTEGVVSVIRKEGGGGGKVLVMNNLYSLGGSVAPFEEQGIAMLAMLLHPAPRSAAVMGVATGITAGTFLYDRQIGSLQAIEISGLVIDKASTYFSAFNNDLFSHPRVKTVREDARIYISALHGVYDIILGELYLPWGPGEGRMYTVEHFRATRRALREGGVFCQWLPMHMLTEGQFRVITASFVETYKEAYLFRLSKEADPAWLAIVGFNNAALAWETVAARVSALVKAGVSGKVPVPDIGTVRGQYLGTVENEPEEGKRQLNTLDNAWIEIHSSQEQMTARKYMNNRINREDMERVFSGEK